VVAHAIKKVEAIVLQLVLVVSDPVVVVDQVVVVAEVPLKNLPEDVGRFEGSVPHD